MALKIRLSRAGSKKDLFIELWLRTQGIQEMDALLRK